MKLLDKTRPITIVGLGQAGGILSYKLLELGHRIRVIESRDRNSTVGHNQTAWGWYRKISLQSPLKKNLMSPDFPIPDLHQTINTTYGPMLITSKNIETTHKWQEWIQNNPETDAKVFTPDEAYREYDIHPEYLGGGGVFQCDTRDYLIDFSKLNYYIWDYLVNHPNCELIDNCRVKAIENSKKTATHLITDKGRIAIDKTIFTLGNMTKSLLTSIPIIKITLPYLVNENSQIERNYISIWNKDSSLLLYGDGSLKLGCGVGSIFHLRNLSLSTPHFFSMGLQGYSNLNIGGSKKKLMEKAVSDLDRLQIPHQIQLDDIRSCEVDLTPNLCPYIFFPKEYRNILSISGFSGSGSMILDNHLTRLIITSVLDNKLSDKLTKFTPYNSLYDNWFPPPEKQTPLSSII